MSRASLWTALRVVYGFVQAKALRLGLLRLFIELHVLVVTAFICDVVRFLGIVNSSSSVTIGGSLNLVAQAIDHFQYFVFFSLSLGAKLEY